MDKGMSFDYMWGDILCTTVVVADVKTVTVVNHTSDYTVCAFGLRTNITMKDVDELFETRCFPESRMNRRQVLTSGDIPFYEPYFIIRKTHGVMSDDTFWIHFHDEPLLSYAEVRKSVYGG